MLRRAEELSNREGGFAGQNALEGEFLQGSSDLYGQLGQGMGTLSQLQSPQGNPYLNASIGRGFDQIQEQMLNSAVGGGGMTNSGQRQSFDRALRDYDSQRRGQAYAGDQSRALQAAGMMPGYAQGMAGLLQNAGGYQRNIEQGQLNQPIENLGLLQNALQSGGARYATGVDALTGGSTSGTTSGTSSGTQTTVAPGPSEPSTFGQLLGLGGTLGGALLGGPGGAAIGSGLASMFSGGGSAPITMSGPSMGNWGNPVTGLGTRLWT
jgi:hypothetical protein